MLPDGTDYTVITGVDDTAEISNLQLAFGGTDGVLYGHSALTGEFFTVATDGILTCSAIRVRSSRTLHPVPGAMAFATRPRGEGDRFVDRGNWGMFFTYDDACVRATED